MGPQIKYTPNLILKVLDERKSKSVLDLYLRNRANFEQFEPTRPRDFYTAEFHERQLRREFEAYKKGNFVRYYIFTTYNLSKIIGSINLNIFKGQNIPYAEIGYKVDGAYQNHGIAYEACLSCIDVIKNDYGINKIYARIHPDNQASIKLVTKLGFVPLFLEPHSANILGKQVDLVRYCLDI